MSLLSFSVLNAVPQPTEAEDSAIVPKEVLVEMGLQTYNRALKFQKVGDLEQARKLYISLLDQGILYEVLEETENMGVQTSPLHTLQFVVHKNYGLLLLDLSSGVKDAQKTEALAHFRRALSVDPTDTSLWYQFGTLARSLNQYNTAIWGFLRGMEMLSVTGLGKHQAFQCLEGLIQTLYDSGLFTECLHFIELALNSVPDHTKARQLKMAILKEHMDGYSLTSTFETAISPEELFKIQSELLKRQTPLIDVIPPRQIVTTETLNVADPPVTLELHRSSFLELGNLLLSLYAKFTSHSSEVKSLTAPLHIELNVEADVEIELREAEEKALNLPSDDNDAAMDSPDVIVIPEDPQTEIKKKRKAVVQEASRSSKRVRAKTVEEETQNVSTDLDIKEQLDPWLPSGWKLSLEDSSARNASMLVPDLSDYFEQIYAKLSTNDSTLTRKGRSKKAYVVLPTGRKRTSEKFEAFNEIGDELVGSDTIQEIQAFVLSIPKSAGLLFVMRHFILHLLKDTRKLSSGLGEITSAMFKRLERHNAGITYLRHLNSLESSENILSTLLTLSEIMFDNFSSAEMDTSESAADTENPLTSITQVKIFERLIAEIASTTLINVEETFKGETEFIRYLWLFAKNEERKGRLNQALTYYSECLERLESAGGFISLNYCTNDGIISHDRVAAKLKHLRAHEYLSRVRDAFEKHDYKLVFDGLVPIFSTMTKITSDKIATDEVVMMARQFVLHPDHFQKRMELRTIFIESLGKLKKPKQSVKQSILLLADVIQNLLAFEALIDIHLGYMMKALQDIAKFMSSYDWSTDLAAPSGFQQVSFLSLLVDECAVCIKLTIYLLSLPRDFLSHLTRALQERRFKTIDVICIRSWILFYHVIKHILDMDPVVIASETDILPPVAPNPMVKILQFIHTSLGRLSLCAADEGSFLKMALKEFKTFSHDEVQSDMHQCYHCLYGITVRLEGDHELHDHATTPFPFEIKAAIDVFETVEDFILSKFKSRSYKFMNNDIRESIDKIALLFKKQPWELFEVELNKNTVNKYLRSDLDPLAVDPKKSGLVGLVKIQNPNIPDVHLRLFKTRAMVLWARYKTAQIRKEEDNSLKLVITQLMSHLYLDPEDIDAWLLLAQSYKSQAEDHLMMHASEIMKIKKTVANLQRRSYLCFTQVIKLFQRESKSKLKKLYMLNSREELAQTVWADFGFVCQSLVSQPMDGRITTLQMSDKTHILCRLSQIAKETDHIISLENAENARDLLSPDKINLRDRQRAIMSTASFAFKKASLLDDSKWMYHYMLAHFYAKLGRKSSDVIHSYARAIELVPIHKDKDEKFLEPLVKLVSYLAKALYRDQIQPVIVSTCLKTVVQTALAKWGIAGSITGKENSNPDVSKAATDKKAAFDLICSSLDKIKELDKKKWQHKVYFRHAWILFHVYNNHTKALECMSSLIQMKPNSRSLVSFWKPSLERPGKHYVYVGKYLEFTILILKELKNIEDLKHLCRKARRAEEILFYPERIWRLCFESLLSVLNAYIPKHDVLPALSQRLSKAAFGQLAPQIERQLDPSSQLVEAMTSLYELKKMNDGWLDETKLDRCLVDALCLLFLEKTDATQSCEDGSLDFTTVLRKALAMSRQVPWQKAMDMSAD